jgi:hypothetical protein
MHKMLFCLDECMRTDFYIVIEINQLRNMNLGKCKIANFKQKMQETLKYLESVFYQAFAYGLWWGNAKIGLKDFKMPKIKQKDRLNSYYLFYY